MRTKEDILKKYVTPDFTGRTKGQINHDDVFKAMEEYKQDNRFVDLFNELMIVIIILDGILGAISIVKNFIL